MAGPLSIHKFSESGREPANLAISLERPYRFGGHAVLTRAEYRVNDRLDVGRVDLTILVHIRVRTAYIHSKYGVDRGLDIGRSDCRRLVFESALGRSLRRLPGLLHGLSGRSHHHDNSC